MAGWRPTLKDGPEPLYDRLAAAIGADVASGVLAPGTRLPPHRDLAHDLGIGIGTVTKAYREAERRGLLSGQVGRGSFVSEVEAPSAYPTVSASGPIIDLGHNTPPPGPAAEHFAAAFSKLRGRADLMDYLSYGPPLGFESHRRAALAWLRRTTVLDLADWRRLICCAGSQQALSLTLGVLCRSGDTILTEAASYAGIGTLARLGGCRLRGLEMDAEGLLPEALDRAAAAGARVLYVLPTLQNPTARTMGADRRAEIVKVARRHDLLIVEDDVYSLYARSLGEAPLAALAPERTFYINGLSKILAPGLRVGFLIPPPGDYLERILTAIRAHSYAPPALGGLIATQWIEDGTADAIAEKTHRDVEDRTRLARTILAGALEVPRSPASLHIWLPMSELDAERVAGRALRGGVEVTPPALPIVERSLASGLRLCIGAPPSLVALEQGLTTVKAALSAEVDERSRSAM